MTMSPSGDGWQLMYDGLLSVMLNRQGGPRGGTDFKAPNWWMGMLTHRLGHGTLTFTGMASLEPATVGKCGYREIFQAGETCNGQPLVDRQHPHDLTMQLAGAWHVPVTKHARLTIAGGPVGEPALGPVAFMHRPSAAENPVAPLSHHTFDSTHIAMGVITAAVDRGPVIVEASLFNGREPDDNRWNLLDRGPLDSWSARVWIRPSSNWLLQVSSGVLKDPEALEPGNVRRTTTSVEWFRERDDGFTAVTAAYGRNDKAHDSSNAFFVEATRRFGANAIYTRFETVQVETNLLVFDRVPAGPGGIAVAFVVAWTLGDVRDFWKPAGAQVGVGADVTAYGVPEVLQATHGSHPFSLHLFLRVRPPASMMGRMWDMTMTHLVERHQMADGMPMMQEAAPAGTNGHATYMK